MKFTALADHVAGQRDQQKHYEILNARKRTAGGAPGEKGTARQTFGAPYFFREFFMFSFDRSLSNPGGGQ